ncbi:TPA: phage tail protein, partial [Enterobacter cloacae]
RNAYSSTGDMLSVGDFGLGSTSAPGLNDANLGRQTAFSGAGGAGAANFFDAYSPLLSMVRTTSIAVQMQITAAGKSAVRGCNAGNWTPWYELYSTQNTTKSSDGTLKAASPVVKVFFDGTYETNDESAGVKVTKIATGEYLVEGCEGLNSDAAWSGIDGGFDIPIDRNKQPLIWLDYEVNADGSVLVKTYHRTHPAAPEFARNELQGINDGDPIDIPSDQFVSVRVQMPQDSIWNQRKAMAEVPDSSAG